ncbi:4-hydroxy-2-oxovalerate aldolase [Thiothrix nivea]|uniref:4-hydroxy-2-oxovalerate aldolase n=1 Tax=Thiothrix nivea (strain ATCC 35100 / DSM 5205 / JP2) TaxID=870187 RepID=A0A656HJV5_THINJ|nr:4-hydroxy-2-oxovalerate aldolase [Thiothrix nivea]EIJ36757.1 4-hydroxy-2-oxovalerate aldolase [Thiothrix nivea DSM 5205]
MNLKGKKIRLHDMSLRDGMHSIRHQFTLENMQDLSQALDKAKISLIEVTHGDGLAGSSVNYGFGLHTDKEYLEAVIPHLQNAQVSILMLPGIGTIEDLKMVEDLGVKTVRVATHCTEADVSEQHIKYAAKQGFDTVGFLMMSHMVSPEKILEQAKLMHSYGANCLYMTDSAGHMLPEDVKEKIGILRGYFPQEIEIGFHGHHNLAMGVANSLAAVEAGANRIDGSVAGFGAGAGNTPLEVFAAVCEMYGVDTGVDLSALMNAAEDVAVPIMGNDNLPRINRNALTLGYAGVYSSFLLHAKRAEEKHGVPAREILLELGRRGAIGGQEDMIEDVALEMLRTRGG